MDAQLARFVLNDGGQRGYPRNQAGWQGFYRSRAGQNVIKAITRYLLTGRFTSALPEIIRVSALSKSAGRAIDGGQGVFVEAEKCPPAQCFF